MFSTKRNVIAMALMSVLATSAMAVDVPISGDVESKCIIQTDTQGVFGNPTPSTLSSSPANGGLDPIVRFDVIIADYYKARLTTPSSFSSSPVLTDIVNWTGTVTVNEVSDPSMSAYSTSKVEYDNVTEIDMSIAGSTWFKISSTADYGYGKALPAGTYNAVVQAECIAL